MSLLISNANQYMRKGRITMKNARLCFFVFIGWLVITSCGDSSSDSGGGSSIAMTSETLAASCQEDCALDKRCGKTTDTSCETECKQDEAGMVGRFRKDIVEEAIACNKKVDCSDTKTCSIESLLDKFVSGYKEGELYKKCLDKRAECDQAKQEAFHSDWCVISHCAVDELKAKMLECVKKSCAEAKTCVDQLFPNIS
jgi:hypothetical protein